MTPSKTPVPKLVTEALGIVSSVRDTLESTGNLSILGVTREKFERLEAILRDLDARKVTSRLNDPTKRPKKGVKGGAKTRVANKAAKLRRGGGR